MNRIARIRSGCLGAGGALLLSIRPVAAPAAQPIGSLQNAVGGVSSNTVSLGGRAWRHAGAGAPNGGVLGGTGGAWVHHAGFLPAVNVRYPHRDTDGDGLPDELDFDNDGDGLPDRAELDGSVFHGLATSDPNLADTDGDGMSDAAEAAGRFDPRDPKHRLALIGMAVSGQNMTLRWIGKGGGTTNVLFSKGALGPGGTPGVVHRSAFPGGVAPWFKTTNSHTLPTTLRTNFYWVQVEP